MKVLLEPMVLHARTGLKTHHVDMKMGPTLVSSEMVALLTETTTMMEIVLMPAAMASIMPMMARPSATTMALIFLAQALLQMEKKD